ncbi:MAG TPA: hypothetical protein VGO55_05320 [Allosphingosinicella sp.]|jgi:hypothetical protein|nr:hypothetical protein [Allosphingosinicella sp.]
MSDDLKFWIGLGAAVVLTVAASAMQHAFQTGSPGRKFFRATKYSLIGLGALVVIWFAVQRLLAPFGTASSAPSNQVTTPTETAVERADPIRTLATQLAVKEWVLNGESCERDGIRFAVEGNELAAYPMGAPLMRYRLVGARGQQLTAELDGSPVIFEIRADGFTHIAGGRMRWFQLCD